MRGDAVHRQQPAALSESAMRLGLAHHVTRLDCVCGRCDKCAALLTELLRDVVFWKGQAKTAIRRRDELDKTILAIDGGAGHWRRVSKELQTLLNVTRNELNAVREPARYRRTPEQTYTQLIERMTTVIQAAIDREQDVEQRITRARDVLYRLKKLPGADAQIVHELHSAWETL